MSPARVVPDAKSVTRVFSNVLSAEALLTVRPSVESVWKAVAIAASWPMVVSDEDSIFRMSDLSVDRALESVVELVELVEVSDESVVELVVLVVLAVLVDVALAVVVAPLAVLAAACE